MHSIAHELRRRAPERKVIYISAEAFMYEFIRALRYKDTMDFKQQFRTADVLMIDDVQFIAGKHTTQEEFFHTFNALVDHNRQIILSADRSPSDLEDMQERLRSRLGWGLVADIHPTDYELRLGILQAKAETAERDEGVVFPKPVLEYVARRITKNVRELEGALNRLRMNASVLGKPVTEAMAEDVLRDLLRANDKTVSIDEIQRKVSDYYGIRLNDLLSSRRSRAVARPRQVAMYLAKQLTPRSLPEIGRKFGGKDHTTVMHGVKRIEQLRGEDAQIAEDVEVLRRALENGR
jgi:chromosomal replication initiator protein